MIATHCDSPVVVARMAAMAEAFVLRSALESAGVGVYISGEHATAWAPHMTLAFHPRGIEILVRKEDVSLAREVLGRHVPPEAGPAWHEAAEEAPSVPEQYAVRAARAALFQLLFPPIILLVPYYYVKALFAARTGPVGNAGRFRKHLRNALILSVPFALLYGCALWELTGVALLGQVATGLE
jgi:hypothetical protein